MCYDRPELTLHHLLCSMSSLLHYYEQQVDPPIEEMDELRACIDRVRAKVEARLQAEDGAAHRRPVASASALEWFTPEAKRKP